MLHLPKIEHYSFVSILFLTFVVYLIEYDVDKLGKPEWGIDRAGGLFGDANNACLIAILTFIMTIAVMVQIYFQNL